MNFLQRSAINLISFFVLFEFGLFAINYGWRYGPAILFIGGILYALIMQRFVLPKNKKRTNYHFVSIRDKDNDAYLIVRNVHIIEWVFARLWMKISNTHEECMWWVLDRVIVNWFGVLIGGNPAPCNRKNKELLLGRYPLLLANIINSF